MDIATCMKMCLWNVIIENVIFTVAVSVLV